MLYTFFGDTMKVKVIDEGHEKDLEESINNFIKEAKEATNDMLSTNNLNVVLKKYEQRLKNQDKEIKKQINLLLLKLKEDKQFKKEFTSYLFDEPIPKVAPLPEKLLDFVENFEYYSMN